MAIKKIFILFSILLSMIETEAFAYDIAVKNSDGVTIYYNYSEDGQELIVTNYGYTGGYSGSINIPNEVTYMDRTRKVTAIWYNAFANCDDITNITLPNGLEYIYDEAFSGCKKLTSITMPTSLKSIGKDAFYECEGLNKVIVKDICAWCKVIFPKRYKAASISIDYYYANPLVYAKHLYSDENTEIKQLVIPDGTTSIGNYTFVCCQYLSSVVIPNSVTTIGEGAFGDCKEITTVVYSNSLTTIDDLAFCGCKGLTAVNFPNSLTSIGNAAFRSCIGLTSITIPSEVANIGDYAFNGYNLKSVYSHIKNPHHISGKSSNEYEMTFSLDTYNNATLYVPKGCIDAYKRTAGWKDFMYIEEDNGDYLDKEKCKTPTISYYNGKLLFQCETEGATCISTITDTDIASYSSNEVQLGVTYFINVYATKEGYENSETATASLCWIDVEPRKEGIDNSLTNVRAMALLIQNEGGYLTVNGTNDGTLITVYKIDGTEVGSSTSRNGSAVINTNLQSGSIAILKIGEKSIKVLIR